MPTANHPDWNLMRMFVTVAETGSLAAAAKSLHVSHATAARHVQQLEEAVGVRLFDRRARGLRLNTAGKSLADAARRMLDAANEFADRSALISGNTTGPVRVSTSDYLADVLPGLLGPLLGSDLDDSYQLELVVTNQVVNLLDGEADIALRHGEPRQQGLHRSRRVRENQRPTPRNRAPVTARAGYPTHPFSLPPCARAARRAATA